LILSAFLIAINWGIFVYAVSNEQVLQASLGYYINPLVSVFLGILIMKEKMKKIQYVSIGLAIAGVMYMTINYGQFPWISILLALSFAFYGLLKKLLNLDSMNSLFVEVLFISPFMLFLLFQSDFNAVISCTTFDIILMLFAGVVTIIPLVLFAEGVKRIPLSEVGFLQYIAPTLMLLLGVIGYGEEFTMAHGVSFSLIWAGLILFSISTLRTESIET
jgi:chloramphenicol-sensitive protein RarD